MARPFYNVLTNQYLNLLNNLKGLSVFRYLNFNMIISLNLETDFSHTAKRGKPTKFLSETLQAGFISAETELLS